MIYDMFLLLFVASIIVAIVSGIMVHSNENREIKNKPIYREILGGLDVFFTGKYLNERGKIWRIPYILSVSYLFAVEYRKFIKTFKKLKKPKNESRNSYYRYG